MNKRMKSLTTATIIFSLIVCQSISGYCQVSREIKQYSTTIPKAVDERGNTYKNNKETYSYYVNENNERVKHGAYKLEASTEVTTDGKKKTFVSSANYVDGVIEGIATIDIVDENGPGFSRWRVHFSNGIPCGSWDFSTEETHVNQTIFINRHIEIVNGTLTAISIKGGMKGAKNINTAYGKCDEKGRMQGVWSVNNKSSWFELNDGENFSETFHNGVLVSNDATLLSYSNGKMTNADMQKAGYLKCLGCSCLNEVKETLSSFYKALNKYLSTEGLRSVSIPSPVVFEKKDMLNDEMFESLLNEKGIKKSSNPDLANNPFGIRLNYCQYDDRYNSYQIFTVAGYKFTNEAQTAILYEYDKKIEEQKQQEAKLAAEEARRAQKEKQLKNVDECLSYLVELCAKNKMDIKLFGADIVIGVDYEHSVSKWNGWFTSNGNTEEVLKKNLKSFFPISEYSIIRQDEDGNFECRVTTNNGKKKPQTVREVKLNMKNGRIIAESFCVDKSKIID